MRRNRSMVVRRSRHAILAHARRDNCDEERSGMSMANATRPWTLDELDRLPEDGNKYELVFGELFVTPPPNEEHETIASRLTRLLDPFVAAHGLGAVYHPRAVVRYAGSQVEPDLMVRAERLRRTGSWVGAPIPILVVEVLSPFTRRRDVEQKRALYLDAGVAEYWVVDAVSRSVLVVRPNVADVTEHDVLVWRPGGVSAELSVSLVELFSGVGDAEE
jgi:Uma2 family endonuclease